MLLTVVVQGGEWAVHNIDYFTPSKQISRPGAWVDSKPLVAIEVKLKCLPMPDIKPNMLVSPALNCFQQLFHVYYLNQLYTFHGHHHSMNMVMKMDRRCECLFL
jgi:hypothetical protein